MIGKNLNWTIKYERKVKEFFFNSEDRATIDQTGINRIIQITKMVYRLAKDDDMSDLSPSQDPNFLIEWFICVFIQLQEVVDEMWVFFNNFELIIHSEDF